VTAVTWLNGAKRAWESNPDFLSALQGNPIRLLTLEEMVAGVTELLGTTVANSQFSRTMQLLKAAKLYPPSENQ